MTGVEGDDCLTDLRQKGRAAISFPYYIWRLSLQHFEVYKSILARIIFISGSMSVFWLALYKRERGAVVDFGL